MFGRMPRSAAAERQRRAQAVERLARQGDRRQHRADDAAGIARKRSDLVGEGVPLPRLVGQRAVDHQPPHVLERTLLGELDGRVLAVVVEALVAADVADLGVGDDHALQAAGHLGRPDLGDAHEVAQRHDADQLAARDHRHVAVATLAHRRQGVRRLDGRARSCRPGRHHLADRASPRRSAAGSRRTSRSVTMPTRSGAVARPRPSRRGGRACAGRRRRAARPPMRVTAGLVMMDSMLVMARACDRRPTPSQR